MDIASIPTDKSLVSEEAIYVRILLVLCGGAGSARHAQNCVYQLALGGPMFRNLPEGRILQVCHGSSHDVFHIVLPGEESAHWHIECRYNKQQLEFLDSEPCWHTKSAPCPAREQFERET